MAKSNCCGFGYVCIQQNKDALNIKCYYMTREILSANIAFESANIQRYYTVQQLIAQLTSVCGETTVKRGRINGGLNA